MTSDKISKILHGISWGTVAAGLSWAATQAHDEGLRILCLFLAGGCTAIARVLDAPKGKTS